MGSDRLHAWFHGSWQAGSVWLWDSLDVLAASGDPQRPGIDHGYFEGFWAPCHTTGSVGAMIPKLSDFLLSYGSQGFEPIVSSFGLMEQGKPRSTWWHCWARSLGTGELVLSGLTVLWNDVNKVLIISNKLLEKFSSVGNVSICIAQGSALPAFPATSLGNYLCPGWWPPCDSQRCCWGSAAGTRGSSCPGHQQVVPWTRVGVLHMAPLTVKWQLYS